MLRVHDLVKNFGRVAAVNGMSFVLKKGSITALLGENGSGKTTTIKLALGFLRPDSGRIETGARRIGYVPERPAFFRWLKGRDVLEMTAGLRGLETSVLRENLPYLCDLCLFEPSLLDRSPGTYSAGNLKKLSLLQNLVIGPDLLVADEPFASLDPPSVKAFRDMFKELRHWGATVLLSSHMLADVEKICDEFILVRRGRAVLQADIRDFQEPSSLGTGAHLESLFTAASSGNSPC